ncbi:ABC transporter substrate-binding protein [Candidatus Bathyarchaeota archaeon]|nr:MAG: ABC transporter substrate-binding protein [Candidatus Bathyarchaeota archaeon]
MKGNTLAIVLLVVGLVVGAGAGYFLAPSGDGGDGGDGGTVTVEVAPLEGKNIQLGYISSTTVGLETAVPLVDEICTPDYNAYLAKLGMDTTMEYLIDDATSQAAVHLEKVQGYKSMDINVFIGGGWSSQAQAALSYCNDNDMLMWSSSSTSPLLAIADDNLLRMCPTDLIQAPAIAEMLWSHGIKAIILIYRGDAWADGIYNYLEPAYTAKGGVILEKIRYAGEATEFSNYLQTAEGIAVTAVAEYGAEHVGVEIISFAEFVVMMTQAQDYPTLYNCVWFGSDGTTLSQQAADDAPTQVSHLRVYSTYAAPAESAKFNDLYDRYYALVSQPFGYYSACTYDIGWVLTESIMNSQSLDATVLIPIQADTAFNNFGASGWNRLDDAGDRFGSNYQIWSYKYDGDVVISYVAGLFDGITGQVTWYTDAIGYVPVM